MNSFAADAACSVTQPEVYVIAQQMLASRGDDAAGPQFYWGKRT
jgi:hypothetical protein